MVRCFKTHGCCIYKKLQHANQLLKKVVMDVIIFYKLTKFRCASQDLEDRDIFISTPLFQNRYIVFSMHICPDTILKAI